MAAELGEAPEAVDRQARSLAAPLTDLAERLKLRPPRVVVTCARGSSAHAATFAKHLIERKKVVPGDAAKSRLFKKVEAGEMPPEDEKPRPTAEEINTLKSWIDAGAPAVTESAPQQQQGGAPDEIAGQ